MATIDGRFLHPGRAAGPVLVLDAPLSFWGGTDLSGRIIDRHHPQHGECVAGTILAMRSGRGSSSSSSVLAEQIRQGTAPAGLVLAEPDPIIVVAVVVAQELYGRSVPVVLVPPSRFASLRSGLPARIGGVQQGGQP
ncbi:DUF126 domain-containing protein [Intrasporangium calvum]|uniref:DUF126 domain-containing protein n=1 Tax=Intrasporangium calvum TaxID=53358 RepID=A0ABT5GFM4_9MICO|nr:DUF126 domain-containing protein [Intrasporangium calvum]MDC5697058.1 DUF126 domain-containing protein [Intrasporangium calvum]